MDGSIVMIVNDDSTEEIVLSPVHPVIPVNPSPRSTRSNRGEHHPARSLSALANQTNPIAQQAMQTHQDDLPRTQRAAPCSPPRSESVPYSPHLRNQHKKPTPPRSTMTMTMERPVPSAWTTGR